MPKLPQMQKLRIVLGVFLMLVGILIAFLLIRYQYNDCANSWLNNLNGFGYKYTSVWNCFITRSKGAIIISLLIGSIPIYFGCSLCKKR